MATPLLSRLSPGGSPSCACHAVFVLRPHPQSWTVSRSSLEQQQGKLTLSRRYSVTLPPSHPALAWSSQPEQSSLHCSFCFLDPEPASATANQSRGGLSCTHQKGTVVGTGLGLSWALPHQHGGLCGMWTYPSAWAHSPSSYLSRGLGCLFSPTPGQSSFPRAST